jgi:hypothetical protein
MTRANLSPLLGSKSLDKIRGDEEARELIGDLLASPVLRRVLCNPTNFSFNPKSLILERIDRSELGSPHTNTFNDFVADATT